jgi:HD superfamily phosphohydrolase
MVGMKTIFCAVHGYTHWEDDLLHIINTPEFQRMKRIKQLAAVHHVFPCATHTRFEHSIGVGHLAECFAKSLLSRQPSLHINVAAVKLAGLCHDIGHGPLSHAYDRFLLSKEDNLADHEVRSTLLLRQIVAKYNIDIDAAVVDIACELIHPTSHNLPMYMYQIIANNIDGVDVDKLDYLCRDSRNTGMNYTIDIPRFFHYSRVIDNRLCYSKKSMPYEINNIFSIRHQLHAQVYQHPVVRAFEHMYTEAMSLLGSSICLDNDITNLECLTDFVFTAEFCDLSILRAKLDNHQATSIKHLLLRIHTRDIYKCVQEIPITVSDRAIICNQNWKHFILDVVDIGYVDNPLFCVHFYDGNGACTLNASDTSSLFSVHPKDVVLRIYDKM